MEGLVDDETMRLLDDPQPRRLAIGDLEPGRFGVVEAEVRQVTPTRTFQRKRGGEGMLCRVTLGDATGEVDLVLWDDEIRLTRDGPLQAGRTVVLRGATVKAGYRGGIEMGLGSAVVEDATAADDEELVGRLVALGDTEVVQASDGPRFKAEAAMATDDGEARVVLWDEQVKAAQGKVGEQITLQASRHPVLDGWWIAGGPRLP